MFYQGGVIIFDMTIGSLIMQIGLNNLILQFLMDIHSQLSNYWLRNCVYRELYTSIRHGASVIILSVRWYDKIVGEDNFAFTEILGKVDFAFIEWMGEVVHCTSSNCALPLYEVLLDSIY